MNYELSKQENMISQVADEATKLVLTRLDGKISPYAFTYLRDDMFVMLLDLVQTWEEEPETYDESQNHSVAPSPESLEVWRFRNGEAFRCS